MTEFHLSKSNINWKSSRIKFGKMLCQGHGEDGFFFISGPKMWSILGEWTPDIKFCARIDITDARDRVIGTSGHNNIVVTKDIYEDMSSLVQRSFKQAVYAQAFGINLSRFEDFENLDEQQRDYFCKQFEKNNMVNVFNISNLFTFWRLQQQGILTKDEVIHSTNRDTLIYVVDYCLKAGYAKEVALEWSHDYLLSDEHKDWCSVLEAFEGDYATYSSLSQNQREDILRFINIINKRDIIRVTNLMEKYPKIENAVTAIQRRYRSIKLNYKDVLIAEICHKNRDWDRWCEYKEHFDSIIKDKLKEDLEKLFIEKYHRIPKILDKIVAFCSIYQIKAQDFLETFNYKLLSRLLKQYHEFTALNFMVNRLDTSLIGLEEKVLQCLFKQDNITKEALGWLKRHKSTNTDFLISAIKCSDIIKDENMTLRALKGLMDIQRAKIFMNKVEEKYYNFKFSEYKTMLEDCTIELNGIRAFMLKDERIALLGELTNCCQELNRAGESAMMYGLLAENAGFWACEYTDGVIFAQGEVWLGRLEDFGFVLVFDNIELANNRSIQIVEPVLRAWCKKAHYQNIIMGKGYNQLLDYHNYDSVQGRPKQPFCEEVPHPYTDAHSCVWLKKEGIIVF